jgi:hypothetical protein
MLHSSHIDHLKGDGFSLEEISALHRKDIWRSVNIQEAVKLGFGGAIPMMVRSALVDHPMLYLAPMRELRIGLDQAIMIGDSPWCPKYVSPSGCVDNTWREDADIFVEGVKDCLMVILRTGLNCGAFKGCNQAKSIFDKRSRNLKLPVVLFDSDLVTNDAVKQAARKVKRDTGARVSCFQSQTKMGATEFFKSGGSSEEFQGLLRIDMTLTELF